MNLPLIDEVQHEGPSRTPRSPTSSGSQAHIRPNLDGTISIISNESVRFPVFGRKGSHRFTSVTHPRIGSPTAAAADKISPQPVIGPEDAIDRKADADKSIFEHLWDLKGLSIEYDVHIEYQNPDSSRGLSSEESNRRLNEFGPNVLTPPPRMPHWLLFLLQFTSPLMVILLVVGLMCFVLFASDQNNYYNLWLGLIVYLAVFVTCYETYLQEAKSDELMERFRAMVPESATLIRDGVVKPVPATDIVPGDLIRLKTGDKVPADCRVISSQSLKVDQSMITGESEPVDASPESHSPVALESKNIIFSGSLVVDGQCLALAIRTGDSTLIGKMVDLTGDLDKAPSTLQADINYFVWILTLFALAQAISAFIVGGARGIALDQLFIQGFVIIMIGNVPMGLPTTITACLFIVAERMGAQNVFVKKLDIIETLGSCTCICTDKTGTLTQNLMSVANIWIYRRSWSNREFASLSSYTTSLRELLDAACLNSRIALEMKPSKADPKLEELQPNGDATELGLYRFFGSCIKNITSLEMEEYRMDNAKMHEIPFNSKNKWQMSIHAMKAQGGRERMWIKGAPDVLLSKCSRYLDTGGRVETIDDDFSRGFVSAYGEFGSNGERVIAFAYRDMEMSVMQEEARDSKYKDNLKARLVADSSNFSAVTGNPIEDFIFVGLVTLKDPPRDEVPQAIADCHRAGVKVVMVTGDHPITAEAIARQIGLITKPTRAELAKQRGLDVQAIPKNDPEIGAVVVRGIEISGSQTEGIQPMTDEEWKTLLAVPEIVFARTSPENKLMIVKQFTAAGHITAMTGDGVNDAPALKQAAIGVSMGLNGSDVAREAGDLVLLDDNFASIVVGIREGRLLFANLKKSVAYTLSHLTPEVLPVLVWAYCGTPQPNGPILGLTIDLLTDLFPAAALAYEKMESTLMQQPPRNINTDKLASFPLLFYSYFFAGMILTAGCYMVYFWTFYWYGVTGEDVFRNNNRFFPATDDKEIYITHYGPHREYGAETQAHILAIIWSSWYLMTVCGQASHIFVCRTTTVSIFEHGVFTNEYVNWAVVIAVGCASLITYIPGLSDQLMQSDYPRSLLILYATFFVWIVLWASTEVRKAYSRRNPNSWLNKNVLGW